MPFTPVPRAVRITLRATQEGTTRITVLHYSTTAPRTWTEQELQALATAWWAAVVDELRTLVHTGVVFNSVTATDIGAAIPTEYVYNITGPNAGSVTGEALPANVAGCISWKTPLASRKTRGRTYMYGFAEVSTNNSQFVVSTLALLGNLAQAIISFGPAHPIPVNLSIYSRESGLLTNVTAYLVDAFTDSQRRRLPQRGN